MVEPLFSTLLTEIFPPFFSTNSLQILDPRPVPDSPFVPSVDFSLSNSNILIQGGFNLRYFRGIDKV